MKKKITQIEIKLDHETKTFETLTQALSDPKLYEEKEKFFETMNQYQHSQSRLNELNREWEELTLELEEKENHVKK